MGLRALRDGLHELGYVEGKNLQLELRWGEGKIERLPALAAGVEEAQTGSPRNQSGKTKWCATERTHNPIVPCYSRA